MSEINITKNLFQHSTTKHVKLRHHFIGDYIKKGDIISLEFFPTKDILVDIFTNLVNEFKFIRWN